MSVVVAVVSTIVVGVVLGVLLAGVASYQTYKLNRKPDYARIAALERELGIGVIEEPPVTPRLPTVRAPIQPGVPFERNGAWFIDTGRWEIGYGSGEDGHRRAIEAAHH